MTLCKSCDKEVDAKSWQQDGLIKEMVEKLNAAGVGGKLASWFSHWNERAIKYLTERETKA